MHVLVFSGHQADAFTDAILFIRKNRFWLHGPLIVSSFNVPFLMLNNLF
ncbi:MAG: hypothetical protein UY04_C0055G0005 [Parcubacteria group bacterium GW2011_GWA2_47_7]|nr:MAG: hypothetical protein UY04_C0055G0005 [Parcubacteria group bacterium GW2011_GWA2_47_7]